MATPQDTGSHLLPNALFGSFAWAKGPKGYQLRARSPSFSDTLAQRFVSACRSWGSAPSGLGEAGSFFQVPTRSEKYALTTSPGLSSTDKLRIPRPGILAIAALPIGKDHAGRQGALGFHGLYLTEDTFAAFCDQAYGLWRSGVFMTSWDGSDDLPLVTVTSEEAKPPEFSPVAPRQAEVLASELRDVLLGGDVVYKISSPSAQSEEHLRLLQLGLPRTLRFELGFSSFFGTGLHKRPTVRVDDTYAVCAMPGTSEFKPGNSVTLPPRRRPQAGDAEIEQYVEHYKGALLHGDLARIMKLSRAGIVSDALADAEKRKGILSWFRK